MAAELPLFGVTRMHCVVFLSKTLYPLLCTGSTQEDPFRGDRKIVDWDVKNQNIQTINLGVIATFLVYCKSPISQHQILAILKTGILA